VDPGDLVKQAHDAGALTMLQVTTVAKRSRRPSEAST
jgi:hypothetical protein